MKREERLHAALTNIAEHADHNVHAYQICGKCIAIRELAADEKARRPRSAKDGG